MVTKLEAEAAANCIVTAHCNSQAAEHTKTMKSGCNKCRVTPAVTPLLLEFVFDTRDKKVYIPEAKVERIVGLLDAALRPMLPQPKECSRSHVSCWL